MNKWCKARNLSNFETAIVFGNEAFFPRLDNGKEDKNRKRWSIGLNCNKVSIMGHNTIRNLVSWVGKEVSIRKLTLSSG